jgi:hypothetical protein
VIVTREDKSVCFTTDDPRSCHKTSVNPQNRCVQRKNLQVQTPGFEVKVKGIVNGKSCGDFKNGVYLHKKGKMSTSN